MLKILLPKSNRDEKIEVIAYETRITVNSDQFSKCYESICLEKRFSSTIDFHFNSPETNGTEVNSAQFRLDRYERQFTREINASEVAHSGKMSMTTY